MKVTNIEEGDWIGLAYWENYVYQIDYFSTPDNWTIGFEIVYRLSFPKSNSQMEDARVADGFKKAFKKAFGLTDLHYDLHEWGGLSVYWRVYWDKKGLDLKALKKCEDSLKKFAENTNTKVVVLEMTAVPRSLKYIRRQLRLNTK